MNDNENTSNIVTAYSNSPSGAWQMSTRRTFPTTWRLRAMTECSRCWTRSWTSLRMSWVRITGWARGWEEASCVWRTLLLVSKSSFLVSRRYYNWSNCIGLYLYRLYQLGLDSVYYQGMYLVNMYVSLREKVTLNFIAPLIRGNSTSSLRFLPKYFEKEFI